MNVQTPEQLLSQKPVIDEYLEDVSHTLSLFSFTNIFAWQNFFQFNFRMIRGCLCVFARNELGTFLYLPPLGKNITPEVVGECFLAMEQVNQGNGVSRIENVEERQLDLFPETKFKRYKKGYEYCYFRQDIAGLKGNPYKSKRSSFNQFVSSSTQQYISYEEGMLDDCMALYGHWAGQRKAACADDIYGHLLDENRQVHELVLRYYQALGLIGRVVVVEGRIRAYSFGFPVNENMFCILFEIADLDIKGLATFIFREFCRDKALNKYLFINAMDDFGMENVKKVKMSFHPCALLPVHTVALK